MAYSSPGFNPYGSNNDLFSTNQWDTNCLGYGLFIQGDQPKGHPGVVEDNRYNTEAQPSRRPLWVTKGMN